MHVGDELYGHEEWHGGGVVLGGVGVILLQGCEGAKVFQGVGMVLCIHWWGMVLRFTACVGCVVCGNDVARGERGKVLGLITCGGGWNCGRGRVVRGGGGKAVGLIVRVGKVNHRRVGIMSGRWGVVCVCAQVCRVVEVFWGVSRDLLVCQWGKVLVVRVRSVVCGRGALLMWAGSC